MTVLHSLVGALAAGGGNRPSLPEYRQIELYTKKKSLSFAAPEPAPSLPLAAIAGTCRSFLALEALLGGGEQPSWTTYLSLPRDTATGKLVAELYRIARVARRVACHPQGHVEVEGGVVRFNGAIDRVALSLEITEAGLALLDSATTYYLGALEEPYPEAYVEAMLTQYFSDLVGEIKRFADEDRVLYQFRQKYPFSRHFRFDCDNPRVAIGDGICRFEPGERYGDSARYPIDFYLILDNTLHIIPVEALSDFALPLADLPRWRARLSEGQTLPARFRPRFAREVMVVGQPMT